MLMESIDLREVDENSSEAKVGGYTTHLKNISQMSQIGNLPQIQ